MTDPKEMALHLGRLDEAALELPAETIIGSLETVKFQTLMANREGTQ